MSVQPHQLAIDALVSTYAGLTELLDNYVTGSEGWRTLVEARRLVEVEGSTWYSYETWRAALGEDE
jgi:hypothetical protein